MNKIKKRRKNKEGNAEITNLTELGQVKNNAVKITIIDYDETHYHEKVAEEVHECFEYAEKSSVTWINIDGVHNGQIVKNLSMLFRLHPLLQEDIMSSNHRPKVDFYENNIFLVTKMLSYNLEIKQVETEQVSFVLGESYLLSFQEDKEGDVFDAVRHQLRSKPKGKLRNMGESYLFYVLLDTIVSGYIDVMEHIVDEIDILEEKVMQDEYIQHPTKKLYDLKRQLVSVRKAVRPLLDATTQLLKEEGKFLDSTNFYMRDLRERINQVSENVEIAIDTCSSLLDLHLTLMSHKTNEVMKVLTVMSAIFLPLSFIAGLYGMNFENMPELKMKMGYYYTVYGMIFISVGLLTWFKIRKWI
jgi:magnesium transporter